MTTIVPKKSVGPFELNQPIEKYLQEHKPTDVSTDDLGDGEITCYEFNSGDMCVYVENGIISWVSMYFDCYLDGVNIHDMDINEFFERFNIPEDEREMAERVQVTDIEEQDIYEILSLGLQLWVNDNQRIDTVIADEGCEDM